MLSLQKRGLYCSVGNFFIDPSAGVEHAVVTHAHSDHARRGSQNYYCVHSGVELLKARLGSKIRIHSFAYGEVFEINGVPLSFHPAGHILGSSQVRMEYNGEVWVASGDYKRDLDPTCEPFEVVSCDVFVTEATFGTPAYQWPKGKNIGLEIYEWWKENEAEGINSVLFGYSLGKTQRLLGILAPHAHKPIYCDSAAAPINAAYRQQGIQLAPTICLSTLQSEKSLHGELIIAPQSFLKSERAAALGENYRTAFASGWMARQSFGYDRGFLLSDHADWNDLVKTVKETGARRVYVQHRGQGALVRELRTLGISAYPDSALESKTPDQMSFF